MAEIPATRWDVGGARRRGEVEASRDQHTWGAATGREWLSHPERPICPGASAEGRRRPRGWRAGLGVPFPLSAWSREPPRAPLSSSSPLPELVLGHEREGGGGKSRPTGGTFPGLEDQGPPGAPGLILHSPRPEALQTPLSGSFLGIGSEPTSHSPTTKVFSAVLFFSCTLLLELGFTLQQLLHIYSDFFLIYLLAFKIYFLFCYCSVHPPLFIFFCTLWPPGSQFMGWRLGLSPRGGSIKSELLD